MLFELVYSSVAVPGLNNQDIQNILSSSTQFNEANGITGCLFFHEIEFVQIIEGEQETVEVLFEKIKQDPRHTHVELVSSNPIEKRSFGEWKMAFRWLESQTFSKVRQVSTDQDVRNGLHLAPQITKGGRLFSLMTRYS